MSRASILLSQKIAPALRFAGAAFALALTVAPASAAFYLFDFEGWVSSDTYARAGGAIESAGIGVGPVSFLGGNVAVFYYIPTPVSGQVSIGCNIPGNSCRLSGSVNATVTSAFWLFTAELGLFINESPQLVTSSDFGNRPLHLTEIMAVPSPLAGTGLPVLAGLLAAWGFLRRRGRAE